MGLPNLTLREETPSYNGILTLSSRHGLDIFWLNVLSGVIGLWRGRLAPQA